MTMKTTIPKHFSTFLLILILLCFNSIKIFGSHVPGANITYQCIGNNQYEVTFTMFEDCGTAFIASGPQTLDIANDCGFTTPTSITLNNSIYQQEVSQFVSAITSKYVHRYWIHQIACQE